MSHGIKYLHSHSAIELEQNFPKHIVLVDEEYKNLFIDCIKEIKPYKYKGKTYYKVPTIIFVKKGGVFKRFKE